MVFQLVLPVLCTLLCYAVFHFFQFVYRDLTSPLRDMDGPKNPSILLGNFKEMADDSLLTDKWREEFGPTFQFKGLFNIRELHTSDPKAISHIVTHSTVYQKVPLALVSARRFLGRGLLSVETEEHKRQARRIILPLASPKFGGLTEVFVEHAVQLRDAWTAQLPEGTTSVRVDVLAWLRRMSLDVIGQAGFDYAFNCMDTTGKPNELSQAFEELFSSPQAQRNAGFRLAQAAIPILQLVPLPGQRASNNARTEMLKVGNQLVQQGKASVKAEAGNPIAGRRDLLSLLLKANMALDLPERQRLSDAEVIAQLPTFFLAGNETTSSATAWALHALSLHPAVQTKLREELLSVPTENPTMDELNALPYLELVVRETMRVHSPLVFTTRMAVDDDSLPLSKPYVDKKGITHISIPIAKGQIIHIPILAINTDPTLWGEDAAEFKPERWANVPPAVSVIPGMWANLLTVFAGPHHCIGFRFTLVEQKALLFTLLRAFEFHVAVAKGGIGRTSTPLQRPVVLGEMAKGTQMPLIVKPYLRSTM